ncbi:hypothetical protein EDB19DRAFT_1653514, partial [Suillus lakei]
VIISSIQHMDHREHIPADRLSLALAMCEATDDSLLIAGSLQSLERSCLGMEHFQAAYGWLTNWDKSVVFILNVPDPPVSLSLPSVLPANPTSQIVCMREVRVIPSHMEFLRVFVNNPLAQFAKLCDIINSFAFPHLHCQLPLTALHRIISQCLVSQICPLITFQPITRTQAQQLDHMIACLVHNYYHFPYHFHSTLLSLPIDLFGMGFPSISHLNDTQGMLCNLNHHIPAFRTMAAITLSNWMCSLNHCVYPLDGPSVHRSFARQNHALPTTWIIVHETLRHSELTIPTTDQLFLLGDVALRHLLRACPSSSFPLSPYIISILETEGYSWLRDLLVTQPADLPCLSLRLSPMITCLLGRWLQSLTPYRASLVIPRAVQQNYAELALLGAIHVSPQLPHQHLPDSLIACDGSMVLAHVKINCMCSVTFAVTAASGLLIGSMDHYTNGAIILHGELYGLVVSALLARAQTPNSAIHSDHLNALHVINSSLVSPLLPHSWLTLPAHSLYRWLFDIILSSPNPPTLSHIKAHTNSDSLPVQANALVDSSACDSHKRLICPYPVPPATFMLDTFSLYSSTTKFVESPISSLLTYLLSHSAAAQLTFKPYSTLTLHLYDLHAPPEHPYVRTPYAYSVLVQLYTRSRQLDTTSVCFGHLQNTSPWCCFGCGSLETPHHLFFECLCFAETRNRSSQDVFDATSVLLSEAKTPVTTMELYLHTAWHLFVDDTVWPLHASQYYLGTVPAINALWETTPQWADIMLGQMLYLLLHLQGKNIRP